MRQRILADHIRDKGYRVGAEVGTREGETVRYLCKHCDIDRIYAIDIWNDESVEGQFDRLEYPQIVKMKGDTVEMSKKISDGSLDWAFIDADHSFGSVVRDINAYLPKIREGGMMFGHDYGSPKHTEVLAAVHAVFRRVVCEKLNDGRCSVWMIMRQSS